MHNSLFEEDVNPFSSIQIDLAGKHTEEYIYGPVMVCIQTSLDKITPVKTRDVKAIQNTINSRVTNVGPSKSIHSDKES